AALSILSRRSRPFRRTASLKHNRSRQQEPYSIRCTHPVNVSTLDSFFQNPTPASFSLPDSFRPETAQKQPAPSCLERNSLLQLAGTETAITPLRARA